MFVLPPRPLITSAALTEAPLISLPVSSALTRAAMLPLAALICACEYLPGVSALCPCLVHLK
jgi:hypothetical protein